MKKIKNDCNRLTKLNENCGNELSTNRNKKIGIRTTETIKL